MKKHVNIMSITAAIFLLYFPMHAAAGNIKGTVNVRGLRSPANILVYLTKAPPANLDPSKTRFVMDQRNLTFSPHILPIPVGATVEFPNHDKVDHNVFSLSRTKKFNLGSYKPGETKTVRFDKPGIVELRCDVHAEMLAYIMVMKNPYFAVTDTKGRFEIPGPKLPGQGTAEASTSIPPGKYFVKTWHEKLKTQKTAVTIPGEETVTVHLDLSRGTPSVLYK